MSPAKSRRKAASLSRPSSPSNTIPALAGGKAWDEELPGPGVAAQAHGVAAAVPTVEIADHRDAARIRRPDGEAHAGYAIARQGPRAETFEHGVGVAVGETHERFVRELLTE